MLIYGVVVFKVCSKHKIYIIQNKNNLMQDQILDMLLKEDEITWQKI